MEGGGVVLGVELPLLLSLKAFNLSLRWLKFAERGDVVPILSELHTEGRRV